jgi:hypothetical protein
MNKIVQFATPDEGLRRVQCEKLFARQSVNNGGCATAGLSTVWDRQAVIAQTQYKDRTNKYSDVAPTMKQLLKLLCDIEPLANSTPIAAGESKKWAAVISSTEDNRENYCKVLKGKTLFCALCGTYTVTLHDLRKVLKDIAQQVDGFKEVCNRKRHCNEEAAQITKKAVQPAPTVKVATKNLFAPLRTTNMDTDIPGTESNAAEEADPRKSGRPPPKVLQLILFSCRNN